MQRLTGSYPRSFWSSESAPYFCRS